ncbi:DUF4760 domain-containing protein [Pseudoalteromonas sp. XMcav11-Q]|uniref:DUF4760 domain-containing protein n=1 Tax=Pseudoalteromonas sp. XMcav11-Q TaxID=3136665 RepID=UPI0032C47436
MLTRMPYWLIILIASTTLFILSSIAYHATTYSILAPLAVLASAVLAVTAATITIKSNNHTFMQTNALAFQQSLLTDETYKRSLADVRKAIINRDKKPLVEFAKEHLSDDEKKIKISINYVLNTWERAGNAVNHGVYDELYLYQAYRSMVIDLGIYFRDYIHEIQKLRNNPWFFKHFTDLVMVWTKRRNLYSEYHTGQQLTEVYKMLNRIKVGKRPKYKQIKKFERLIERFSR